MSYPIIFIHGLGPSHRAYEYDEHEEMALEIGRDFHILDVPFGGDLFSKKYACVDQIKKLNIGKFHAFGHSAGGLIWRLILAEPFNLIDQDCLTCTSMGTPHKGTPIADAVLKPNFDLKFLLYNQLMNQLDGEKIIEQMSVDYWKKNKIIDSPLVKYFSMPHYMKRWKAPEFERANFDWLISQGIEYNDCTVPTMSQVHGTEILDPKTDFYFEGSHVSEICSILPFGKYGAYPWSTIMPRNMEAFFRNLDMVEKSWPRK